MKTWTHDKTTREGMPYPPGPWMDEPDKAHWVDEATGLDCLIHRGPLGALCGYVGVPRTHPFHGRDYDQVDVDVEVHGGLTYAALCQEDTEDEGHGICHVPLPGRDPEVWWLGFDCGHSQDIIPGMLFMEGMGFESRGSYKDFDYVKAEVEKLARQLAEVKPLPIPRGMR